MRRDAEAFASFGLDETKFAELEARITAFSNLVTDIEKSNEQVQITEQKDLKAEELRTAIRSVMTRVAQKYGAGSARYANYGSDSLAKQNDADLLVTAKRVVRVGTANLNDLAGEGLQVSHLNKITELNDEFNVLLIDQKLKIGERDIQQEDRVEDGNKIYLLLTKYTQTGQDIWESSDVAKYNDYIIYNTPSGEEPPEDPQV
ncbi:hypothetical protein OMO38_15050 [Chryseobacterium sp. 09-1422]|uniref:Uncharacterized protein n=1 Tax=Chryseobacterium kimseyorum TaxID=2984028 RepID=A0ABT3I1C3_9FLAO|nr:hypothetical protein [Chryseobacterium kimseyorum]MCW3169841.1 hypothetical protein [Chryseobacterium kimseyorum]